MLLPTPPKPPDSPLAPVAALVHFHTGERFRVGERPLWIGRSRECDIQIAEMLASARHCTVARRPDGTTVVCDQHSRNGTAVNGVPVAAGVEVPIQPGMQLVIGTTCLIAVGEGRVPVWASSTSSLLAAAVPVYGSARAASRQLRESARTIGRARRKKIGGSS